MSEKAPARSQGAAGDPAPARSLPPASSWHLIGELASAGLVVAIGIAVTVMAFGYPEGSQAYPVLVGLLLAVAGFAVMVLAIRAARRPELAPSDHGSEFEKLADSVDDGTERVPAANFVACAAAMVLLVVGLEWISFLVVAPIAGIVILRFTYGSSWRTAVIGAIAMTTVATVCMHYLGAPIPGLSG